MQKTFISICCCELVQFYRTILFLWPMTTSRNWIIIVPVVFFIIISWYSRCLINVLGISVVIFWFPIFFDKNYWSEFIIIGFMLSSKLIIIMLSIYFIFLCSVKIKVIICFVFRFINGIYFRTNILIWIAHSKTIKRQFISPFNILNTTFSVGWCKHIISSN